MNTTIFGGSPYLIELLTPRQSTQDIDAALERFGSRYGRILDYGAVVSVPDNPMGHLHFTALEVVQYLDLRVPPESLLIHLNTFHRKADLDQFLNEARERGVRYLLCVSGDGGPRLPKLDPADLGQPGEAATSVGLLSYIHREHPGAFTLGVAFNQYEPAEHELRKLEEKLDAGASFIVTQPVVGPSPEVADLERYGLPVYAGAWMSRKIALLSECVGYPIEGEHATGYDPLQNLREIRGTYPDYGTYLSLLSHEADWGEIIPRHALAGAR